MSKSLIKNVDGIGIWIRDDTDVSVISPTLVILASAIVMCFGIYFLVRGAVFLDIFIVACGLGILIYNAVFLYGSLKLFVVPAYEIYPGSDHGIFIPKTNDLSKDQLAICKAAKQIESQCHEIAAKRRELDRIAASCK